MLFGQFTIDKTIEEHVTEIAALANDPQTLIFLDTNILTYLYKLHAAARQEFFQWSDAVAAENRLVIPAWAASEYLSRVTSKTLDSYTPKSKEASQATKLLGGLLETASLFVDGASLTRIGFPGDRAAFIAGFRTTIDALAPYTRVFSQDFDSGVVHQQIEAHLSSVILGSDLAALCTRATQEANGRFEHRLPPGYRDDGKPENRLGDLIIWYEILEKSAVSAADFPKALFISRDEKSDWVYAPAKRIELARGVRKPVTNTNPEIKLADPRLVAEFERRTGHTNFAIANLPALVEGMSRRNPAEFSHLAAAIQITIQESTPAARSAGQDSSTADVAPVDNVAADLPPEPPVIPVEVPPVVELPAAAPVAVDVPVQVALADPAPPRLHYDADALQDGQYPADAPSEINAIIRALKSHNWYTQNPAVVKVRTLRSEQFPASSWFVLGRNLYQAACGNSQKAIEFLAALEGQLRQFPPETAQHLLAGMLYEIYFDSHGAFRDSAKFSYADKPLSLVTEDTYAEALEFILFHLWNHRAQLKFLPGDRDRKTVHIASAPAAPHAQNAAQDIPEAISAPADELRSVVLDGVELMRDVVDPREDAWQRMLQRAKLSPERIREKISEELAIPKWALALETQPPIRADRELAFPAGREFHPRQALQAP
jgi:hypothetical protein